jgi:glycosyltransferase involved in cell wall biosynthesis
VRFAVELRCGQSRRIDVEVDGGRKRPGRPRILHVSADFPDPVDPCKTPVIRSLVELTSDRFRHDVVSLNRRSPGALSFLRALTAGGGTPPLTIGTQSFDFGQALTYQAPARGLFHATMLHRLGDWLAEDCLKGPLPDLLVGHKLTIEGVAVRRAAKRLQLPFSICIQGDTDTKVLAARPDLSAEFARVFHEAAVVSPFTPWALQQTEARLGKRVGPTVLLPCPSDLDTPLQPRVGGYGLVSVFHLKNYRRKNLVGMAAAMRVLVHGGSPVNLAIIGGGGERELQRCGEIVAGSGSITFEGALERSALRERLNGATAFVLPSLRESFGLVFIEALFAGIPVIYPKNAGIDGYFDDAPFAIAVDARRPSEIAKAMKTVVQDEARLKEALGKWQKSTHAERFRRPAIGAAFTDGLMRSLGQGAGVQPC